VIQLFVVRVVLECLVLTQMSLEGFLVVQQDTHVAQRVTVQVIVALLEMVQEFLMDVLVRYVDVNKRLRFGIHVRD